MPGPVSDSYRTVMLVSGPALPGWWLANVYWDRWVFTTTTLEVVK